MNLILQLFKSQYCIYYRYYGYRQNVKKHIFHFDVDNSGYHYFQLPNQSIINWVISNLLIIT